MNNELYHSGVKGMKWGVRNDKRKNGRKSASSTPVTKTRTRGDTTTITSRSGNQRAKLKVKRNRGAKLVAKHDKTKVKVIVSNTAAVSAGAMRVAAAFVPGLSVLNGVATAVSLAGTVASINK